MSSPRLKFLFIMLLGLSVSSQLFTYGQSSRRGRRKAPSTVTASQTSSKKPPPESTPSAQSTTPYVSEEGRFKTTLPREFTSFEKASEQSAVTPYGELIKVVILEKKVTDRRSYDQCIRTAKDYRERFCRVMPPAEIFRVAQQGTLRSLPAPVTLSEEKFEWFPDTGHRVPAKSYLDIDLYAEQNFSAAPGLTTFISIRDATGTHYIDRKSTRLNSSHSQ